MKCIVLDRGFLPSQDLENNLEVDCRARGALPSFQELTNSHQSQARCSSSSYSPQPPPHSDSQQCLSPEEKTVTCFGWKSMAKNLATCHIFLGRAINSTIALVFCPHADCLGGKNLAPEEGSEVCKSFTARILFSAWQLSHPVSQSSPNQIG